MARRAGESPRTVGSVDTVCNIIEALRDLDGAGVTELADHLDLSKGTVHSHLATLYQNEFVTRADGRYDVGLRFLAFGEYAKRNVDIYDAVRSEIESLADETGEVAQFMIEEHGGGVHLYKAKGADAVDADAAVGNRSNLHTTALGKSILAHLPDSRVEEIVDERGLPPATPNTITDRDELHDELERIRERGYAVDDEEVLPGVRCVATSITDAEGEPEPLGAISVSTPASRMDTQEKRESLARRVLSAANVVEVNIQTHRE